MYEVLLDAYSISWCCTNLSAKQDYYQAIVVKDANVFRISQIVGAVQVLRDNSQGERWGMSKYDFVFIYGGSEIIPNITCKISQTLCV